MLSRWTSHASWWFIGVDSSLPFKISLFDLKRNKYSQASVFNIIYKFTHIAPPFLPKGNLSKVISNPNQSRHSIPYDVTLIR